MEKSESEVGSALGRGHGQILPERPGCCDSGDRRPGRGRGGRGFWLPGLRGTEEGGPVAISNCFTVSSKIKSPKFPGDPDLELDSLGCSPSSVPQ